MPCQHCSMFIAESAILLDLQATYTSQVGLIVISKCLKRHSQEKRRAPAYSRALHQLRGVVQTIVHERLKYGCQRKQNRRHHPANLLYSIIILFHPFSTTGRFSSCVPQPSHIYHCTTSLE